MLLRNFLIIYCLISKVICQFSDLNQGAVHKNWHFKLYEPITLKQELKMCELNNHKRLKEYVLCLQKVFINVTSIYSNSFQFENQFKFGYLGHPSTNKELQTIWFDLIENYVKANQIEQNKLLKLKIIFNYFSLNNHIYREYQPINDENPNLLMHADNDLKENENKCIYGHQIQSNNESFHFKFGNCDKKLAFICIKPIQLLRNNQSTSQVPIELGDRCSLFKTIYPGGNWLECDKLIDIFDHSPVEFKLSETQKCCMFNLNMKEDFENAKQFCSRFHSEVYSFKTKGYKRILENYATFLNINYGKSNLTDLSNFWTSCKLLKSDLNNPRCPEDFEKNNDEYLSDHSTSENGLEIFLLNYEMNKKEKFDVEKFSLTSLSDSFHNLLKDFQTNTTIHDGYYNQLKDLEAKLRALINDMVILVKKKAQNIVLETKTLRSRKLYEKLNETDCFIYKKTLNSTMIHVSLPFLKRCYHLTLFKLASLDFNIIERLYFKSIYEPNKVDENFRTDLVLKDISYNTLYGILNVLGIYDLSCTLPESSFNSSKSQAIFMSKPLIDNKVSNCTNNASGYFLSTIPISNRMSWNQFWPFDLKDYLDKSSFVLMLHSYSLIVKILHFDCNTQASKIIDLIVKCMSFYNKKFCLFTCPIGCKEGNVWQFKHFRYSLISNICQSAQHSNLFIENSPGENQKLKSVLFLELNDHIEESFKHKTSKIRVSNNQVTTNIWPSNGFSTPDSSLYKSSFYFRPRLAQVVKKTLNPKTSGNQFFLLIKSVHPIGALSARLYLFGNGLENLYLNIRRLVIKESENQNFKHKLDKQKMSSFISLNFSSSQLNNFFSMNIMDQDSIQDTIKFPVNFEHLPLDSHTIHLDYKNARVELKGIKSNSGNNCSWFVMNYNTKIKCSHSLNFTYTLDQIENTYDFSKQTFVTFMQSESSKFTFFTRIIFFNASIESECKNGGRLNENKLCVCPPGFGGLFCENMCQMGYFGQNCNYTCPNTNCSELLICLQDPIGCSCALGWKGFACNQTDTSLFSKISSHAFNCSNSNQTMERRCLCRVLFKKNYLNDEMCAEICKNDCEIGDFDKNVTEFSVNSDKMTYEESNCTIGDHESFENFHSVVISNNETRIVLICYFNISTLLICENVNYSINAINFVKNNRSKKGSDYLSILCEWNYTFDINSFTLIEQIENESQTTYKLKFDLIKLKQFNANLARICFFVFKNQSSNPTKQILIGNYTSSFCLNDLFQSYVRFNSNLSIFFLYATYEFNYNDKMLRFSGLNYKEIKRIGKDSDLLSDPTFWQNETINLNNKSSNSTVNQTVLDDKTNRETIDARIRVDLWKMVITLSLIFIFSFKLLKKCAHIDHEESDWNVEFDLITPKVRVN